MLADHAELTREHLSELEAGNKVASLRTLHRIAKALGMTLHQFFENTA